MTKLVCALLVDLDDAVDFPGSEGSVLGRPLAAYPLMAARTSAHVRRVYAVTGSPPVKAAALQYDAIIIDPPAGKPSLEDYLRHGLRQATADLSREDAGLELLVMLFPNAPAVTKDMIDSGVEALLDRPELDSALSVAPLERWSPGLTRQQTSDGLLETFLPPASAAGPAWHPTWGVTVLRPGNVEPAAGGGTWPWLGRKVLPIKTWGPGLIDYHWQLPGLEYWLKKNGVPDLSANLERQPLPKPQLSPKGDRR
ncbi:MAG: hypothetical protein NTY77_13490 [Elusimicrobia bacterium]|nr:hypothetical protein [Elusimicrobiota bacterium]